MHTTDDSEEVDQVETIAVVLSVDPDQTDAFERGFREHELPIWEDFRDRGVLVRATLSRMDISSHPVGNAQQYLIVVMFATGEGHHLHDNDPRFMAWNKLADAYQVADGKAFGGETLIDIFGDVPAAEGDARAVDGSGPD
jgi:hypothetical protein